MATPITNLGEPPVLRFPDATFLIRTSLAAKRNVMIWGPPGIGKTDLVGQIAKEREVPLVTLNAPQMESVDFRGIPYTVEHRGIRVTHWAPASFMVPDTPFGFLFIDEITSAQPATILPAMQLFLDHKIGDVSLPPGWCVIAAGNRVTDNSLVYELPSPLRNRMVQLTLQPSPDDWFTWADEHGIDTRVIKFLKSKPSFLYDNSDSSQTVFPTPRTWAFLSSLLAATPKDVTHEQIRALATSVIGPLAASTFVESFSKGSISPSEIRANPQKIPLPEAGEVALVVKNLAATASSATSFQDVAFLERLNKDYVQLYLSHLTDPKLKVEMGQWLL